jgi:glycosyltransferase involved in cell wall biosynthesis
LNSEAGKSNSYRLLYLGNVNSPLIRNLAVEVKKQRPNIIIDIVSPAPLDAGFSNGPFTQIWALAPRGIFGRIKGLKLLSMMLGYRRLISNINIRYDCVHMLFCDVGFVASSQTIRALSHRFVISFFGSDYYASSPIIIRLLAILVNKADTITAANQKTANAVRQTFKIGEANFELCRFGLSPLDTLKSYFGTSKAEVKVRLGFDPKECIVVCGYNASENQQHEAIINALKEIKNELPAHVRFVFPISSNAGPQRKKHIETLLQQSGLRYSVIKQYLSDEELAQLRFSTDIMIQVQRTDQLSGSMQESIFAGSCVITGAWLPYEIFDEIGIRMVKINHIEHLGGAFLDLLKKESEYVAYAPQNAEAIWRLSSWEHTIKSWLNLYRI